MIISGSNTLINRLKKFHRRAALCSVSGLLTIPELHANTVRLELLVHLISIYCDGSKKPNHQEITKWVNSEMGKVSGNPMSPTAADWEDPIEDVFISNIITDRGNSLIFEGNWVSNDFWLQQALNVAFLKNDQSTFKELKRQVNALLALSDALARRCGLKRWTEGSGTPQGKIGFSKESVLERGRNIFFHNDSLTELEIDLKFLEPFILDPKSFKVLNGQVYKSTILERHPLIKFEDGILMALPSACSPAIRHYLLEWIYSKSYLDQYYSNLRFHQFDYATNKVLSRLETSHIKFRDVPKIPEELPFLDSVFAKYDDDKVGHIILLHDNLQDIIESSLSEHLQFESKISEALNKYMLKVSEYLLLKGDISAGLTLVILCGLGRGQALSFNNFPDNWDVGVLTLADFSHFADSYESSIIKLSKLFRHRQRLEKAGVKSLHASSLLDLYSYWKGNSHLLIPKDTPFPAKFLMIHPTDSIRHIRKEARIANDIHAVKIQHPKSWLEVARTQAYPFFEELKEQPIYGSPSIARRKELYGCVETERGPWWIILKMGEYPEQTFSILHQVWDTILNWLNKFVKKIERYGASFWDSPPQLEIVFTELENFNRLNTLRQEDVLTEPEIWIDSDKLLVKVKIPIQFLLYFNQPTNCGEKKLISTILNSYFILLREIGGEPPDDLKIKNYIEEVFKNPNGKQIHLYVTKNLLDQLKIPTGEHNLARFTMKEDMEGNYLGLAWNVIPASQVEQVITEKEECNEFLKNLVGSSLNQITNSLRKYGRKKIISKALKNIEALYDDKNYWNFTAKAILNIHSNIDNIHNVAQQREARRAQALISNRILIEMALCISPEVGDLDFSDSSFDDICSKIAISIEYSRFSDCIYSELGKPILKIYPSGIIDCDFTAFETVLLPFSKDRFKSLYRGFADIYNSLYEEKQTPEEAYTSDFNKAFEGEFKIPFDRYLDGFVELFEMAEEKKSSVVSFPSDEIKQRLCDKKKFANNEIEAFFDKFVLIPRSKWGKPPKGFSLRDIEPWRFQRRLSVVAKPLIQLSTGSNPEIIFGVKQMGESSNYLIENLREGWEHPKNICSSEMKTFIGKVANEKGEAFEDKVAETLRNMGWESKPRYRMSEFEAPSELGDVDVLCWDKEKGLLMIECKRLKPARTMAEIADVLKEFQGEARDSLQKHLDRMKWIRCNSGKVFHALKLESRGNVIHDLLVTNFPMPIKYRENLPLSSEKILSVDELPLNKSLVRN